MLIPFNSLTRKYHFQPEGVLHIGASEGQEANAYHNLRVNRVVWIEAIPTIFARLKNHLQQFPKQEAVNACISNKAETVQFNVANNGGQSSSFLEFGTHTKVHPEVKYDYQIEMKTQRIDEMDLNLEGLDFLNIDIQGAEMLALEGMGDKLDQFKYAYLEVNWKELYQGCALFPEMVQFMKSKGFICKEFQECGNTGWGDAFFMK